MRPKFNANTSSRIGSQRGKRGSTGEIHLIHYHPESVNGRLREVDGVLPPFEIIRPGDVEPSGRWRERHQYGRSAEDEVP